MIAEGASALSPAVGLSVSGHLVNWNIFIGTSEVVRACIQHVMHWLTSPRCRRCPIRVSCLPQEICPEVGRLVDNCMLRLTGRLCRDVMTRHVTLHGDSAAVVRKPRKVSWYVAGFNKLLC